MSYDAPTGDSYATALVRINGVSFDFVGRVVTIHLGVYRNAQAGTDERNPVSVRDVEMTPAQFQSVFGGAADPRPRLYTFLLTLTEFAGATLV
jgi:hypothetical protein